MKENGLPYDRDAGFKVPEGYFQNFETKMMARLDSPESRLKENPFRVPDNYFEQLEGKVFEKLEDTSKKGKVIPLFNRQTLSYIAGIAAVLAVLFSSIIFSTTSEIGFEDLDVAAVENYLIESLDLDNPNNAPAEGYNFSASENPNINKEALLEYLNDHIEEPALLLNED